MGRTVAVHYTLWFYSATGQDNKGQQVQTSRGQQPFSFVLGAGQVISGWDLGIANMREGGQRRLIVPPAMAYGSQGQGPIPSNTTLVFDVEVLSVQ